MEIHMAPHHLGCKGFIGPQRHGSLWFYHGLFSLLVLLVVAMATPAGFAQSTTPVITWWTPPATPAAIPYGTPLSGIQLNATATTIAPAIVDLTSYYNEDGISTGSVLNGGYDGEGYAFDTTLLGSSFLWNGLTYNLGQPEALDAVSNKTIAIPAAQQGEYASFVVFGSSVNNASSSSYSFTFTANYTDGTTSTVTPQMSDWAHPQDFPGESVAKCTPSRDGPSGSQPLGVCVYAYQLTLDPTRVLQSITLPTSTTPRKAVVLAMGLIPPTVAGTFAYSPNFGAILTPGTHPLSVQFTPTGSGSPVSGPTNVSLVVNPATPIIVWPSPKAINYGTPLSSTQLDATATAQSGAVIVPLSEYYNANSFYPSDAPAGESTNGGFDCGFDEYSSNLVVAPLTYNGINFPLGTAGEPDSVSSSFCGATTPPASGTVVALPAGNFGSISILGAATTTGQTDQPFVITYADGSTSSASVSLSSWAQSSGYTGETIVLTTPTLHTPAPPSPQLVTGPVNIYGYQIPVDSAKTVQSITLPATRDVVIFGMALSTSAPGTAASVTIPSSPSNFVYTPPSGTILPVGTNETLSVAFTPTDTTEYADATGTTTITVNQLLGATAVLNWPTPASITYGTPLSATQLDATASLPDGTALQGTYAYTPAAGTVLGGGTQTLSVVFTPNSGSDLAPINGSVQLTVAKAPVTVGLSFSASSITTGANETITVTVASTIAGTPATPTGTVTLLSNGVTLGSPTLVNGVATYSTTALPAGTDVITAVYSGDSNFLGTSTASAASASNTITVTGIVPGLDFTFTPTSSTIVQGTYGKPQQITFHLAPIGGAYPSTVTFNAISPPGFAATYTFSPVSVAQNAGATDITLTVLANGPTALNSTPSWTGKRSAIGFAFLLLPLLGLRYSRSSGRRLTRLISCVILMALSLGAVGLVTGCGADSFENVFQITVTATSGTDQHAVGVNYEVPVAGQ
jgi:hypothetical protein